MADGMEELSKSKPSAMNSAEDDDEDMSQDDAAQVIQALSGGSGTNKSQGSNDFLVNYDEFLYPSARLVRRMRRCERRMVPYLDEWMLVDAVLTSHELVLFEVPDDELDLGSVTDKDISQNGCKGMRLCDVAKGRKIVSQFDLNDVDFVGIDHQRAIPGDGDVGDIEENCEIDLEFWQGGTSCESYEVLEMNKRWEHVDKDRLKIHVFSSGTLYLRFVVDLKDLESKNLATYNDAASEGKGLVLWVRTIARCDLMLIILSSYKDFYHVSIISLDFV